MEQPEALSPEVTVTIQREADRDLSVRLLHGAYVYPLFLLTFWLTTKYPKEHLRLLATITFIVGAALLTRLCLAGWRLRTTSSGRLWIRGIGISVALLSGVLGALLASSIREYGFSSWEFTLVMIWTSAFAVGSVVTFAPSFTLMKVNLLPLLLPAFVTRVIQGGPQARVYSLMNILLICFVSVNGRKICQSYIQHLLDREREKELHQLKLERERAIAMSEAKGQLLANMSHELRTPMNGILGMADLALDSNLERGPREQIQIMKSSAESLLRILDDIFEVSQLDAGEVVLKAKPYQPDRLMEAVRQTVIAQARLKSLSVFVECDEKEKWVLGDAFRVRQILLKLLSNAIKFTEKGTICLRARTQRVGDAVRVTYEVQDTGIGVTPEQKKVIFSSFSQADNSYTRKYGGAGLGLSICSRLVELMGGTLSVESEPGQGSKFFFIIETRMANCPDASRIMSTVEAREQTEAKPLKVLLAEDNEANQAVARAYMKRLGHSMEVADNGQICFEKYRDKAYDLILMDIMMPVLGGLEATAEIRKYEKLHSIAPIPIIALTALTMEGDRERFRAAGMDDYVAKPYQPAELDQAMRRVVQQSKRQEVLSFA